MQFISPKDSYSKLKNGNAYSILDVREQYEHDICSIDAIHIPMGELASRMDELSKDQTFIVMCKTGARAAAVANLMEVEFQHQDVHVLEGGILKWIEELSPNLELY